MGVTKTDTRMTQTLKYLTGLIRYFGQLSKGRLILWCYLCWYLSIVGMHFDASVGLWLSSLGMSGIIGVALKLSTSGGASRGAGGEKKAGQDGWTIFRLFLMPFCVSSYAALIKGKDFWIIFPLSLVELAIAGGACVGFVLWHWVCKGWLQWQARVEEGEVGVETVVDG